MPTSCPLEQIHSKNVEGERDLGKQGLLRGGGKTAESMACGNEGHGVRKPWSEAGLGPSEGSRVAPI